MKIADFALRDGIISSRVDNEMFVDINSMIPLPTMNNPNFETVETVANYSRWSSSWFSCLAKLSTKTTQTTKSNDDGYLRVPQDMSKRIKNTYTNPVELSAQIGIGPNMYLACPIGSYDYTMEYVEGDEIGPIIIARDLIQRVRIYYGKKSSCSVVCMLKNSTRKNQSMKNYFKDSFGSYTQCAMANPFMPYWSATEKLYSDVTTTQSVNASTEPVKRKKIIISYKFIDSAIVYNRTYEIEVSHETHYVSGDKLIIIPVTTVTPYVDTIIHDYSSEVMDDDSNLNGMKGQNHRSSIPRVPFMPERLYPRKILGRLTR